MTPIQTKTNAKKVPMFVMSAASPIGMSAASVAIAMIEKRRQVELIAIDRPADVELLRIRQS